MQLLVRSDGNLAVTDCRRRLAAQHDSVIGDNVDAHGWVLLTDPGAVPPVTHTHALFANQSQSILDNLVALLGLDLLGPRTVIRNTSGETGNTPVSMPAAAAYRRLAEQHGYDLDRLAA
jgi:hypothetical protein